jgi:hypothetical protein
LVAALLVAKSQVGTVDHRLYSPVLVEHMLQYVDDSRVCTSGQHNSTVGCVDDKRLGVRVASSENVTIRLCHISS